MLHHVEMLEHHLVIPFSEFSPVMTILLRNHYLHELQEDTARLPLDKNIEDMRTIE